MSLSASGIDVTRTVPEAVVDGLRRGSLRLHGGVVRWAPGTKLAGQIVAHLMVSTDDWLQGIGLVPQPLAPILKQLETLAHANIGLGITATLAGVANLLSSAAIFAMVHRVMLLADMSLSASGAGFAALQQRLDRIEHTLDEIKATTTAILHFLQISQRAELRQALASLHQMHLITNPEVRVKLLVHAATTLGTLHRFYAERLAAAQTVTEAMACEEYFLIAGLGQVRCYAELRELTLARTLMTDLRTEWITQAQRVAQTLLIGEYPERFLFQDMAEGIPVATIIEWLDFAYGEQRGYGWLDTLRPKFDPWLSTQVIDPLPGIRRMYRQADYAGNLKHQQQILIPALQKLTARQQVLESYVGQYELLETSGLTPLELETHLAALPADATSAVMVLTKSFAGVGVISH